MACQNLAGGETLRFLSVQVVPSHSHVLDEDGLDGLADPPNRTDTPRRESKAIAAPNSGPGDAAGASWVHVVPFHSQVSPKLGPVFGPPPNRTVTPRSESKLDAAHARPWGDGVEATWPQFSAVVAACVLTDAPAKARDATAVALASFWNVDLSIRTPFLS
jgi:hypothetical protein